MLTTGEMKKRLVKAIRPHLDQLKESRSGQYILPKIGDMFEDWEDE